MATLRLNEAIARSEMNGKKVLKKDLAAKIWPNSRTEAQTVNMSNLCSGITQKINPEWITIICQELGCTADFLLGINDK